MAVLTAAVFILPAAAADISGSWSVNGEIAGNEVAMKCNFTQTAEKVTGSCSNGQLTAQTMGSVAENKVTFQHDVQRDQVYTLIYNGTLDATGSAMQGEINVMGVSGSFSAKKDTTTAAAPAAAASSGPDLAGTWTINGDVVGNVINMKCTFKRDGDQYTGTCSYAGLGDSPTRGKLAGNVATFENEVQREQLYDLTYTGTLDTAGSSIRGDIAVAGVTGTFEGKKEK